MTEPKTHRPYSRFGWGWRERRLEPRGRKWVIQKHVKQHVDVYGTWAEFVNRVSDLISEQDIESPHVDSEVEYGTYGDRDRDVFVIEGWRDATEEEIAAREKEIEVEEDRRKKYEEQQIESLKKIRPELFK
jgi:nicotinamide mononucleotide adenylyltransferase